MTTKTKYLTSDELADALEEAQAGGNRPTERLCRMFRTLSERILRSPKFSGYSFADKEDMSSAAMEKMIKNIKNWKPEYRDNTFNYFTTCCHQAFYGWLRRYYKWINQKREALKAAAQAARQASSEWGDKMERMVSE